MNETFEAKIRNLITPYFNLIKIIVNLQDPTVPEESKEAIIDFLKEHVNAKNLLENCEQIIDLGKAIDKKVTFLKNYDINL